MVFISATRLRVRSVRYLISFFIYNERAVKELLKTPGLLAGKELIDKNLTFWTLTLWETEAAMKAFRNGEAHRKAMRKLPVWCDEGSYVHWQQEEAQVPDWQEVYEKMIAEGRKTKVKKPSADQLAGPYPPIKRTQTERRFPVKPL